MSWVLRRLKGKKLVLQQVAEDTGVYSYTRIPLTDEQAQRTLVYSKYWEKSLGNNDLLPSYKLERVYDEEKFDKLVNRFLAVLREHKESIVKTKKHEKYETDIPGTSRIVMSPDRTRLHIARRQNKKTGKVNNFTYINSVCVDDKTRTKFFNQSKQYHGVPNNPMYCIYKGDPTFDEWVEYIRKEYERLQNLSENNKI